MLFASSGRPKLGRARVVLLLVVMGAALSAVLLRPATAAATQEVPAAGVAAEEEHGGDIVFKVTSKTQKFSVLYSHQRHIDAGIECEECHEKTFKKELNGSKFKMADINKGQYCGTCHTDSPADGVKHKAFPPKKNCLKCHSLKVHDSSISK